MMRKLSVEIEVDGNQKEVGTITGESPETAVFQYSEAYIASINPRPISISLPLQEEPFSANRTRNYFEGLLPEGFTRRSLAQSVHIDENDYLSILEVLGKECLGALKINHDENGFGYQPISSDDLKRLAEEGISASVELITKAHLSLTGASGKVGLYLDEDSGEWYLPTGEAPSTHIVKQSHIRLKNIVTNEQMSLLTAKNLGVEIPESFIINTGAGKDADVLFATKRYDRIISPKGKWIGSHQTPLRLHQEDFAQALGISDSEKYEKNPSQHYLQRAFELLVENSRDPLSDELKLWDRIVFNVLIGNTDGHLKNFSLLYSDDLQTVRLAPAYDIVCTAMYPGSAEQMAFSIGGDEILGDITINSFIRAADEVGLSASLAIKRVGKMTLDFQPALQRAALQLSEEGYMETDRIRDAIMANGGIKNFR